MRTILRRGLWAALILIALAAVGLGWCAAAYRAAMRIDNPNGIDEERYVRIGGIDQWIQIRGADRNNPVLLWLNGGPGFTTIPSTYAFRTWEKRFTVVMWDQRGEGKTFARSGTSDAKTMTVAQMTNDGIAVADYVRHRLHRDRIILLGHSWGSILGMHMVHARPDLFSAYVGTGQIVKLETGAELAYPLVLAQARRLGNRSAEQELLAAGPPPYPAEGLKKWAWVKWANDLDTEPHTNGTLTPAAIWLVFTDLLSGPGLPPGAAFSQETMWSEMLRDDLPSLGLGIKVPVVFIQGEDDRLAVTALAKRYFDRISAPRRKYVERPGAGHLAIFDDREAFLKALVDTVIPLELPERAR